MLLMGFIWGVCGCGRRAGQVDALCYSPLYGWLIGVMGVM